MPTCKTTPVSINSACLILLIGGLAAQYNRLPLESDHRSALFVAAVLIFAVNKLRCFAYFVLGAALFLHAGHKLVEATLAPGFAGDSMLTVVRVVEFPEFDDDRLSMLVTPLDDPRIPVRVRVSWYMPAHTPQIGEVWQLELRLRRPRGNSNPGGFSLEDWSLRERIHATGYVVPGDRNQRLGSDALSPLETYRQTFVNMALADGRRSGPVLAAVGVGARHAISGEQWDRFRATGTSHLMAISGLHVGLAAVAGFVLVGALAGAARVPGNHLIVATLGSATTASLYAMVSGFAVPSQRAMLMLGLANLAFVCRRRADPARIVALAALIVFVVDPLALMAPGFALSFAAVIVLLWSARARAHSGFARRGGRLFGLQFGLLFGLMPISVLFFQRTSLVAPLVNFVAVPLFSLITVPLLLLSLIALLLWPQAASLLLELASLSVEGVELVIQLFVAIPKAEAVIAGIGGPASGVLTILLLPALWVLLPRGWPGRWVAVLGVVALLLYQPLLPRAGCAEVDVLDIGQGTAVSVRTREHVLLFDTGRSYRGGGSAADRVVLPFLDYLGLTAIDTLVISHADNDHAGGAATILNNLDVTEVFAGEITHALAERASPCQAGEAWLADGIEFRFLHPPAEHALSGNDASCVLLVTAGEFHLLLTGDIEAVGERSVVEQFPFEKADIVLIPHHGSLTSSSSAFIRRLRPDYAIATTGYANRWGLPKARVVSRWEAGGAVVMNTAESGAIGFRICARGGISGPREERQRRRRFWFD